MASQTLRITLESVERRLAAHAPVAQPIKPLGTSAILALASSNALHLIIPETQRARHWDGYRRVMQTGISPDTTEVLAVPALCDVTPRRQQHRALRRRLQALEAERP